MPILLMPRSQALKALLCGAAISQLGHAGALTQGSDQSPGYRDHGAHVHGIGRLNVAVDGHRLLIELVSPAMDLIGFEHQPRTAEQQAELEAARARLEQPEALFAPNAEADCRLTDAQIDMGIDLGIDRQPNGGGADGEALTPSAQVHDHEHDHDHEHEHEHEHDHADEHHESHADVYASYVFECQQPRKLTAVALGFFQAFPRAQKLQAQLISETHQDARELTRADQRLTLSP